MTSKKIDYFFIFLCAFFLACLAAFAVGSVRVFGALADYRAERAAAVPQDLPEERISRAEFMRRAEGGDFPAVFIDRGKTRDSYLYGQDGETVFFAEVAPEWGYIAESKLEEAGIEVAASGRGVQALVGVWLFALWGLIFIGGLLFIWYKTRR